MVLSYILSYLTFSVFVTPIKWELFDGRDCPFGIASAQHGTWHMEGAE